MRAIHRNPSRICQIQTKACPRSTGFDSEVRKGPGVLEYIVGFTCHISLMRLLVLFSEVLEQDAEHSVSQKWTEEVMSQMPTAIHDNAEDFAGLLTHYANGILAHPFLRLCNQQFFAVISCQRLIQFDSNCSNYFFLKYLWIRVIP